jgi:hypothetical protein
MLNPVAHDFRAHMQSICCVERIEMLELGGVKAGLIKQTLAYAQNNRSNVGIDFIHRSARTDFHRSLITFIT